jgi:hypothetical protein
VGYPTDSSPPLSVIFSVLFRPIRFDARARSSQLSKTVPPALEETGVVVAKPSEINAARRFKEA